MVIFLTVSIAPPGTDRYRSRPRGELHGQQGQRAARIDLAGAWGMRSRHGMDRLCLWWSSINQHL